MEADGEKRAGGDKHMRWEFRNSVMFLQMFSYELQVMSVLMSLSFNLEQAGEFWFYLEGNDFT